MDALAHLVGDGQMLVVLDNCEHLLDASQCAETQGGASLSCDDLDGVRRESGPREYA
jgi:hypothetical protein